MKHVSLFSGIGGFELASEWMGWNNMASCEIDEFPANILKYYWPNSYHHSDVKTFNRHIILENINGLSIERDSDLILTGGFPCQPYSAAGKRLGKEDERHLWPHMLRIIEEFRPRWVVGENVRGLLSWNKGQVFDEVCTDLENVGYEVIPIVIPAAAVGAPHRRDRIWFVARNTKCLESFPINELSSNPYHFSMIDWNNFPIHHPTITIDDIKRLDISIREGKWIQNSIKAYGNAIVPQVVFRIFRGIEFIENDVENFKEWQSKFLNHIIKNGEWSKRFVLDWKQKVTYGRIYTIVNLNKNHNSHETLMLGTPRSQERPRSKKFLEKEKGINRIPTPSELIQSEELMTRYGMFLPTPLSQGLKVSNEFGKTEFIDLKLLPTPKATEVEENYQEWRGRMKRSKHKKNTGKTIPNIGTLAVSGLLPTPTSSDYKNVTFPPSEQNRHTSITKSVMDADLKKSSSDRLSPFFVEEMMGFPDYWTLAPFLKTQNENNENNEY